MRLDERRKLIVECLGFGRYNTYQHLADEFGVLWFTIYRDMRYLKVEYPLIIICGIGGDAALIEDCHTGQRRLTQKQVNTIRRAIPAVCEEDRETLKASFSHLPGSC